MFLDDSFFLSRHKLDCNSYKNMEVHFQVKLKGNKLLFWPKECLDFDSFDGLAQIRKVN